MHVLISFVTTCRPLSHFKDINLCLNYIFGTDQEKKKKRQTLDGEVAIPISSHLPDFLLPSSPLLPYLLSLFFSHKQTLISSCRRPPLTPPPSFTSPLLGFEQLRFPPFFLSLGLQNTCNNSGLGFEQSHHDTRQQ
jgi:hypothetical protein